MLENLFFVEELVLLLMVEAMQPFQVKLLLQWLHFDLAQAVQLYEVFHVILREELLQKEVLEHWVMDEAIVEAIIRVVPEFLSEVVELLPTDQSEDIHGAVVGDVFLHVAGAGLVGPEAAQ